MPAAVRETTTSNGLLLMPGEPGYDAMTALTEGMESVGRGCPGS